MAGDLVDPFDQRPQQPIGAVASGGLVDPFDAAEAHYASGYAPGVDASGAPRGVPKLENTDQPLGFVDRLQGGMISNPGSQLEFFAGKRFPNMPVTEAIARYGRINGDPVYRADSGALMRENAGDAGIFHGDVAGFIGKHAGPAIGGTVGGILGGAPGAALGGAAGRAGTQLAAQTMGDEQTAGANAFDIAVEGFLNGIGWKAGEMIGGAMTERKMVRDIAKFDKTGARQLQSMAKSKFGIDLTPAEASNLGSLINEQTRLGVGMDEAGNAIKSFLTRRREQIDEAVTQFIGNPPPATAVGENIRATGKAAIADAKKTRREIARPEYEAVVSRENLLPREFMKEWEHDAVMQRAFRDVRNEGLFVGESVPDDSLLMVDAVKKHLDGMVSKAVKEGDNGRATALRGRRDKMVSLADKHFPQYAKAREAFAGASPEVNALEKGIEGTVSRIKDSGLKRATRTVLSATENNADEVAKLRLQFETRGKEGEWDDVLNTYLRQIWEGPSTKDVQGGPNPMAGANFRNALLGTKAKRDIMRAAMGKQRYGVFSDLMDVLQATGRVPNRQSMTEPAQQAAKREMAEASPIFGRSGTGLPVLGALRNWWVDMQTAGWRDALAAAVTSPDSIRELEKLNRLRGSPGSKAAIEIVTTALTKAGVMTPASALRQPADDIPQPLQQRPRK